MRVVIEFETQYNTQSYTIIREVEAKLKPITKSKIVININGSVGVDYEQKSQESK